MSFKNYNSLRQKLYLPEYGRHIHRMINDLMNIEDRELRNRQTLAVIGVMGNLNTQLRDTVDFRHKLWDHLFIMSGFQLDVDSPYPTPSPDIIDPKPQQIKYQKDYFTHKQYGKNIKNVINLICKMDDEQDKFYLANNIAKYMKVKSFEYNQEYPSNEVIINDIKMFSKGDIVLDDDSLDGTKLLHRSAPARPNNARNNNNPLNKKGGNKNQRQHNNNNNSNNKKYKSKKR